MTVQDALGKALAAQTARLRLRTEMSGRTDTPAMTMQGTIDFDARRAEVLVSAEESTTGRATPTLRQVFDGDTLWIEEPPAGSGRWMQTPMGTGSADPLGLLDLLRGEVSAERAGDSDDDLVVWKVSVDTDEAVRRAPARIRAAVERTLRGADLLGQRLDLEVAIEPAGQIRRVRLGLAPAADDGAPPDDDERLVVVLELFDFGIDAAATPSMA